jgi:hypothetical protein
MIRGFTTGMMLLLIFLGGCISSRNIAVEIRSPSRIPVPQNVRSLSLILIAPGGEDLSHGKRTNPCQDPREATCRLLAAERALLGYSERIYEGSDMKVNNIIEWVDTAALQQDTLTEDVILSGPAHLCEDNDTAGILVILKTLQLSHDVTFSSYKRWPHEAKNKIWSKTILYSVEPVWTHQADFKVRVNNGWYLYDCKTKQIIFEGSLEDSVQYKVDGATPEEVKKKLPSLRTSVEKAGFVSGWDFAGWILPSSVTVPRKYFGSGSGPLRQPTRDVKFRQWDRAEEEWLKILGSLSGAKKSRVLYNLALARERQGDYKKALEYISRAEDIHPSPEIKAYKKTLEREKKKRER